MLKLKTIINLIGEKSYMKKINSCKVIKYFFDELEISYEGYQFFRQTATDLYEEKLGLKEYKEFHFDGSLPVRLLWEDGVYKIKCNNEISTLNCETVIYIDQWALGYHHFEEVSSWNNKTFSIFWYNKKANDLVDHQGIILDHFLLFEHYFDDGVLFADDLARFIKYQFEDQDIDRS